MKIDLVIKKQKNVNFPLLYYVIYLESIARNKHINYFHSTSLLIFISASNRNICFCFYFFGKINPRKEKKLNESTTILKLKMIKFLWKKNCTMPSETFFCSFFFFFSELSVLLVRIEWIWYLFRYVFWNSSHGVQKQRKKAKHDIIKWCNILSHLFVYFVSTMFVTNIFTTCFVGLKWLYFI